MKSVVDKKSNVAKKEPDGSSKTEKIMIFNKGDKNVAIKQNP